MTDIPDIKAALLDRRYPYDFIQDLLGDQWRQETGLRRRTLEALLSTEQGAQSLYVLLVAGTRKMLDDLGAQQRHDPAQLSARLAEMLDDDAKLNDLARNLTMMLD